MVMIRVRVRVRLGLTVTFRVRVPGTNREPITKHTGSTGMDCRKPGDRAIYTWGPIYEISYDNLTIILR